MVQDQLKLLVAIAALPLVGPARLRKIAAAFVDLEDFFRATARDLITAGLEPAVTQKIIEQRSQVSVDERWREIIREDIRLVVLGDDAYPPLLRDIADPPTLLAYRGDIGILSRRCVAIVGSRSASPYGLQVAERLGRAASDAGITVVSGLARGIDSAAHQGALAGRGETAAFLGTGLDWQSIDSNAKRAVVRQIVAAGGAVLSEFPCGTGGAKHTFPLRNRLIAGVSAATVVVEGAADSGALITASCALDYNREVFAVPGSITQPLSVGPHRLIQAGAQLLSDPNQLLEFYNCTPVAHQEPARTLTALERQVIDAVTTEPVLLDDIMALTGLSMAQINVHLSRLELAGLVRHCGGQRYVRI